jgi:type IV pilus assembly protein PilM
MASGLGLDLGASAIKAVKVRRRGNTWQIVRAWRAPDPTPPPPPVKPGRAAVLPPRVLPEGVGAELRRAGVSGRGAVGLTGRDLMVKYVSTPPVPPWKLQMMMDLEVKGTSGADVCGDFGQLNIPGDLTRELVSLVCVCKSSYVEHQMSLAGQAGVSAEWCSPNAIGLFNAFLFSGQYRPGETTAVLDVGRDNLDLVIQSDGVLYFARSATGGGRRFTDAVDGVLALGYEGAERYKCSRGAILVGGAGAGDPGATKVSGALCEVADSLAASLRSATMFCRAQAKLKELNLERIVLSGGGSRLEGLTEYLAEKTRLPVDVLDPASRMDISSLPRDQQALFDGPGGGELSVAVGLAMMAADESLFRLEVVPDNVVSGRKFWRGTVWALAACAALAGLVAVDVAGAARRRARAKHVDTVLRGVLGSGEKNPSGLRGMVKSYETEVAKNQALASRARLLAGPAQRNVPVLGFIKLLRDATPDGIVLTKLRASRPQATSGIPGSQVVVTVEGLANAGVLAEGNEFKALENYRNKLLAESAKLAFKIDDPRIVAGDKAGSGGRSFTLNARIFTLGIEPESDGDGGEETVPAETERGPVVVPRGLPSKPVPFSPGRPTPEPPDDDDDGGDDDQGTAFDGGGRP